MGIQHPHRTWCPQCRCTFAGDRCACGKTEYDRTFAFNRFCDCYACDASTRPMYLSDLVAGRIKRP